MVLFQEGSKPTSEGAPKKSLQNLLTNITKCGTIKMSQEKGQQNVIAAKVRRKEVSMKNATLSTIYTALTNYGFDNAEVMDELSRELHRGDAVKAAKAAVYDAAWPIVEEILSQTTAPLAVSEIWEAMEGEVPDGFTKSKLSYGLTHQWADLVVKVEGKVNTYRKA